MKLLLLACLIVAASAFPGNLGSKKCTWGPAYWCKNFQQATECNAIEHCKSHVWKSNDLCGDCKVVVEEVHNYVKNNGTQVLALMNLLCLELGSMAEECKLIVALYGKTALDTIANLTADSEKFCQELGLCKKTRIEIHQFIMKAFIKQLKKNPKIQSLKSVKVDYCADCKRAFAELKDVLTDKDLEGDIVSLLESLCVELGSYAAECKSIVDLYGPMMLEELAKFIDPTAICTEIGLCNSTTKINALLKPAKVASKLFFPMAPGPVLIGAEKPVKTKPVVNTPDASVECVLCEFIMKELDGILGENATKEEIEQALDEVCSLLPSTIKSECDALVQEFGPEIIDLLLQELQPDEICTALKLCSSGEKKLDRVSLHKKAKANDRNCVLCKAFIKSVEESIPSNATEDEIKKALEAGCKRLPASIEKQCEAFVKKYLDVLVKLILKRETPEKVCQAIGLCTAGAKSYLKNKCFLGESYWCANYKNALKCEALAHCNYLA